MTSDTTPPQHTGSLFDLAAQTVAGHGIAPVRLSEDETALLPFTDKYYEIRVHYCDEPEIKGYVACTAGTTGGTCVLCQAGKRAETRCLFPVYLPTERRVGVLNVSKSMRPLALLPQLIDAIRPLQSDGAAAAPARIVLLVRRRPDNTFELTTTPLRGDVDDGAAVIKQFVDGCAAGTVDPTAVVQRLGPEQFKAVAGIREALRIKGLL
jgi:hypothetical protein